MGARRVSAALHIAPPDAPYDVLGTVDDADWSKRRGMGVGASETAILLGVHPRHGEGGPAELWAAKRGYSELARDVDEELARWGHVLEPVIIQQFSTPRYAGWPAHQTREHLRSKAHPWALASLDGWTLHPTLGWIPLEAKTVSPWIADRWVTSAPVEYWWQVQSQILVTGKPAGALAALVGGGTLMWELIPRDDAAQRVLATKGAEFWRCVEQDRVPLHVPTLASVRALYPAGSESGAVQLSGAEWARLDERLENVKRDLRVLERERESIEARIKDAIGKHESASLDNGVAYTHRTQRRAETTIGASEFRVLRRRAPKGD
jgi:putative phage-type endonuclease